MISLVLVWEKPWAGVQHEPRNCDWGEFLGTVKLGDVDLNSKEVSSELTHFFRWKGKWRHSWGSHSDSLIERVWAWLSRGGASCD
jgi:hypothetical protein